MLQFAIAQTVTEYPLPTANAKPTSIVAGPDGNLWFTEYSASKIGRITTAGVVMEFPIPNGGLPVGIAEGPDGNLWFAEYTGAIGKITTSGVITEYPVPSGGAAYAITQGPDGNMWFTEYLLGNIGKITTTGAVTEYTCSVQSVGAPCSFNVSIVSGPDGNLWFAPTLAEGYLGVITPNGVVSSVLIRAVQNGLAVGPDGNIWFTAQGEIGKVPTASPNIPNAFYLDNNTKAFGITPGPDGNLWFTEQVTVNGPKIAKSTTAGLVTEYPLSNANALPGGITTGPDGNIWFTDLYGNNIGVFTLSGGAATGINVSPTALTFSAPAGGAVPPSQTIQVTANSSMAFTATSSVSSPFNGTWLTITPSGSLSTNQSITVSVNPAGFSATGSYSGSVYITSGSTTQTVQVALNVTAPTTGNVTASPSSLTFGYTAGSPAPQSSPLSITSAFGPGFAIPYSLTKTASAPGNWLVVNSGGSMVANGTTLTTPEVFDVSVAQGLAAGVYTGSITLSPTGGSPLTVPVTLTVSATPTFVASPNLVTFTYQPGGPSPQSQGVQISEQSGLFVGFTVVTQSSPAGWITVTPLAGTTPNLLIVNVAGMGLAAGTYSGKIVVTLGVTGSSPLNIPVTMTVTAPTLTASPSALSFTLPAFGPAPPAQMLQISAPSGAATAFHAAVNGFVDVTPTSATTPATLSVSIDPNALQYGPGTYASQVVIIPTAGAAQTTVPVTITVTEPPPITATQTSLAFGYQTGGSVPAAQSLQVTAGTSTLVALAAVSYENWLSVNPGDVNTPATFTVSVNPTGLAPGTYAGSIGVFERLSGTQPTSPPISVSVTLTVTAGIAISASPATLTFTGQSGAQARPSQTVEVTASGNAALPFSAAPTSAGNWLTIVPYEGTTPAGIVVTATPTFLAAGVYQGSILINGTAIVTVTFTVSAATNSPIPSITRVVNGASYSSGAISPGEIITIIGTNLGPATAQGLLLDASGNVATSLNGVSAAINGYDAPLLYVSASQINCVAPYEIASAQTFYLTVQNETQTSAQFFGSVTAAAPGIFTSTAIGSGQAAVLNGTGSVNNATNPASAGSTIVIYMTGEGQTSPGGVTGKVTIVNTSSGPLTPQPITPPTVTLGGSPALVTFYGEAPGLVSGVLQINAIVPSGLAVGNASLAVSFGTANTQSGVTVAIR